jgi:hypothetical protein
MAEAVSILPDDRRPLWKLVGWQAATLLASPRIRAKAPGSGVEVAPRSSPLPTASSAPVKTNEQNSKKSAKDCDDEWRADQETMMRRGMTEDSYVEQCSVEDDVPAIPSETKTNAAPSAPPK